MRTSTGKEGFPLRSFTLAPKFSLFSKSPTKNADQVKIHGFAQKNTHEMEAFIPLGNAHLAIAAPTRPKAGNNRGKINVHAAHQLDGLAQKVVN